MRRCGLVVVCGVLSAVSARAEMSSACFWAVLVDAHAMAIQCSSPLAADAERYGRLRQAVEAQIMRDASLSPGGSPRKARAWMDHYGLNREATGVRRPRCDTADVGGAVSMLRTLTTAANTSAILAGLGRRKNPYAGDCL